MASKPDPPTQASMAKALNVRQQVDDYCRLYPNGDAVFHQDSAPSHASWVTQEFLTDQQVQFLRPQQWMPNSPDAAPCDYILWGYLKNKLNKRRISTLRGLQKAIREGVKKNGMTPGNDFTGFEIMDEAL
ncbi:hypothetical protein AVEN_185661-1 [Araneus ventricosus]|uniref:Tc1-like transposase DDE domain-containing protein n=1 Tax=Araneus ventricosus TaxID=182803 RepID=A0A4Y2FVD6_ARAVE|nr:hypothetical protein AVEN_185661-1 [Araneus ventricosus]